MEAPEAFSERNLMMAIAGRNMVF